MELEHIFIFSAFDKMDLGTGEGSDTPFDYDSGKPSSASLRLVHRLDLQSSDMHAQFIPGDVVSGSALYVQTNWVADSIDDDAAFATSEFMPSGQFTCLMMMVRLAPIVEILWEDASACLNRLSREIDIFNPGDRAPSVGSLIKVRPNP